MNSFPLPHILTTALVGAFSLIAIGGENGKLPATSSVSGIGEPLATGLDMQSFNPPEGEKNTREAGELLSLFEEFLTAQAISGEWNASDLEKLYIIVRTDLGHARSREAILDDKYDALKDEFEELEDYLTDDGDDEDEDGDKKKSKKKKKKDDDKIKEVRNPQADLANYLRLKEIARPIKSERNDLRKYITFEEPLLATLERARCAPEEAKLRYEACDEAARILYSLFADQMMSERGSIALPQNMRLKMSVAKQFMFRAVMNAAPMLNQASQRKRKLYRFGAQKEAYNLAHPQDPNRFVTIDEMAKMTHGEVAALDVATTNPLWHSRRFMQECRPDTWNQLEQWLSHEVSAELLDKKKFREKHPDFHYNLSASRRVLLWDDLKSTATSPKIETEDVFGQSWKLKWGEESATEPVSNRLKLLLGAKYTDLVYADVDGSSHLLILPSELERKMSPHKTMPLTTGEFVRTMKESNYDFNIEPFILSHGVITESNAESILWGLPAETPKKFQPEKFVGQTWIRFSESMVEAKHDAFTTGGPVSNYTHFASRDRALRQMKLIAFWMGEVDVKEDNFKSVTIRNFNGASGPQYLEYFHDSGSGLGGAARSGELNKFSVALGTGGFMWVCPEGRLVLSNEFQIYRPSAWNQVSFADHRAAAEHLMRLTGSEIHATVEHSLQPDFYKKVLTWKLIRRRDLIAKTFGLATPDKKAGPAPTISVPLTTREDRVAAARLYCIPLVEIENDLARMGFIPEDARDASTEEPYLDLIVKNGVLQDYHDTVITGILRDVRHPGGFVNRISRFDDGGEWQSLRLGIKPIK
ncbi:hypothetical protein N9B73_08185 [Verrucomicrobiales bacterium]|nr:hypothetical protein [Verrucomicrobiales bacterium]